jgi:hypothetical protein
MFTAVKEDTLNEEKFLSICHECGYEPYLYDKSADGKSLSKKYVVSLHTPTYSPESEENIVIVFNIDYNKKHLRSTLFECVIYNKIKIVNYDGQCYLTTQLNGITVTDPAILKDELSSIDKEVKLFNITEKLRRIRSICKESVCE